MKEDCNGCALENQCPGYYNGCFDAVNHKTIEDKHIDRLYNLLHELENDNTGGAAALQWAIFMLEMGANFYRRKPDGGGE